MPAHLIRRAAALCLLALGLGTAPATASVVAPDFPFGGFGTLQILEASDAPFEVTFTLPPIPGPAPFVIFLLNQTPIDTLTGIDLELGRLVGGAFQASTGEAVFVSAIELATLAPSDPSFVSLAPDGTAAQLDFGLAYASSTLTFTNGIPPGLIPADAVALSFEVTTGLSVPGADPLLAFQPFAIRFSPTYLPEPSALALMLGGWVLTLCRSRHV